mmetsp:Transcript_9787/g.24392  ORF Transcript_9787/g.24392 Transcript_9787/m.24392 type:complete len:299 (-) Transcript_9787:263-1159(-)|eukprot:CAMPEP_0202868444 /NCGR_PEP_ID=MMETSP1391-20130828/10883_1 /ASSEMBLY_ACC=CAM_ASM_000867 /TAXON_ID=1034604 /ORGANISM="Chlamydomonas leiostraca, Strain SAG 11-49" /LENGTH=298 /DNA_ID=CAMNT_0049548619 /DNA_START=79 /DNA_END=975 /DNA_ORIENTATION=+
MALQMKHAQAHMMRSRASCVVPKASLQTSRRQLLLGTGAALLLPAFPGIALAKNLPAVDPSIYADAAKVEAAARAGLRKVITGENAGNLVRMAFHDAGTWDALKQTGGADGSLRLELDQPENGGLKYGQAILTRAREDMDEAGKAITWADLYQLAGAEAVEVTGGPKIKVVLGRRDTGAPNPGGQLPSPAMNAQELIDLFVRNGYTATDVVALSGSHTLGASRKTKPKGPMDATPATFDNTYFKLLLSGGGAFPSDRTLAQDPQTRPIVEKYAKDQKAFFDDFASAYIKMGYKGFKTA